MSGTIPADLSRLRVFVEVVRRGGFSAAARALEMPRSTVSRWVRELEMQLGVRLLERTTRQVQLTEIGGGYFERAAIAVDAAVDAGAWAQSQSEEPQGMLVIATFQLLAETLLAPPLLAYLQDNPRMSARVVVNEQNVDLVGERVDVAVRIGEMVDSTLVVRKLASLEVGLVASPDYLADHDAPVHPRDLVEHPTLFYSHVRGDTRVLFTKGRQRFQGSLTNRCPTNCVALVRQLTLGGLGIGALPLIMIREDLARGRLVRLLPKWRNDGAQPIFVAYPSRTHLPRKVRVFVDLLKSHVTSTSVNRTDPHE